MFYMFYKSKRTNSESNPSIIRVRNSIFVRNPGLDLLSMGARVLKDLLKKQQGKTKRSFAEIRSIDKGSGSST